MAGLRPGIVQREISRKVSGEGYSGEGEGAKEMAKRPFRLW
jgi:hypothetical protein